MHFKRQPIFVQAFHYDLSNRDASQTTGIGVQLQKLNEEEIKRLGLSVPNDGCAMRVVIPFDFVPPQEQFDISGLMNQIIVIEDFNGSEKDLPEDAVRKMSRPIIELIETLTYEITTLATDHTVNLNFVPQSERNEDVDQVDDSKQE